MSKESGSEFAEFKKKFYKMLEEIKKSQEEFNASDEWGINPSPS